MKKLKEIKDKLHETYQNRLKIRLKKFLSKYYRNCKYNKKHGNFYICVNKKVCEHFVCVCDKNSSFLTCKEYECKNNEKDITEKFRKDVADPKICGQVEPKIAVLLWVMHQDKQIEEQTFNEEPIVEKKPKSWIKRWFGN